MADSGQVLNFQTRLYLERCKNCNKAKKKCCLGPLRVCEEEPSASRYSESCQRCHLQKLKCDVWDKVEWDGNPLTLDEAVDFGVWIVDDQGNEVNEDWSASSTPSDPEAPTPQTRSRVANWIGNPKRTGRSRPSRHPTSAALAAYIAQELEDEARLAQQGGHVEGDEMVLSSDPAVEPEYSDHPSHEAYRQEVDDSQNSRQHQGSSEEELAYLEDSMEGLEGGNKAAEDSREGLEEGNGAAEEDDIRNTRVLTHSPSPADNSRALAQPANSTHGPGSSSQEKSSHQANLKRKERDKEEEDPWDKSSILSPMAPVKDDIAAREKTMANIMAATVKLDQDIARALGRMSAAVSRASQEPIDYFIAGRDAIRQKLDQARNDVAHIFERLP
ncbi:hypothetical protein PtB15_8B818 [Puccinia triticina]|nr:hypothetical protein PtB15_8B818 [Puccinia triticina]